MLIFSFIFVERLPADDQEFIRTATKMYVKPYVGTTVNPDKVFPKVDTCFFHLSLPEYSSPEILKERYFFLLNINLLFLDILLL